MNDSMTLTVVDCSSIVKVTVHKCLHSSRLLVRSFYIMHDVFAWPAEDDALQNYHAFRESNLAWKTFTSRSPMSSIWSQAYLEVKARKEVYLAQEAVPGSEM